MRPNELTAVDAAAAIRAGRLKSIDLVDACLERIAEREHEIGAWQCLDVDRVRAEARRRDGEAPAGLLHGVPVGVKDIIDTVDLPTALGTALHAGRRPDADAACVAMLRRAGAIVLGKTVTTEFAYFHPGRTRNPRATAHTPGGSSSGSAAAVADCMVPVALGTQTAGSITRPASFCGVTGYKPSFGDFSMAGVMPFAPSLDTLGTLTRTVEDARLVRSVLIGAARPPSTAPPRAPLRVALARTPWWQEADAGCREGLVEVVERLARSGLRTGEIELPAVQARLVDAQKLVMAYEAAFSLASEIDRHGQRLSAALRELLESGSRIARDDYRRAMGDAAEARKAIEPLFGQWDLLLTPAARGEAPHGLEATGDPLFARPWTLLGLPTLTLPAFDGPTGLPIGVQLVAAAGSDDRMLSDAGVVEAALQPAALVPRAR